MAAAGAGEVAVGAVGAAAAAEGAEATDATAERRVGSAESGEAIPSSRSVSSCLPV